MKKIFLLVMLFALPVFPQFVEYNYGTSFSNYPLNTLKIFGVGNRGFDARLSTYNPKYNECDSSFSVTFSLLSNLSAKRTENKANEVVREYSSNNNILPEFTLGIKNQRLQFLLAYYNQLDFSYIADRSDNFFYYPNNGVTQVIEEENAQLRSRNSVLQFSAILRLFKNTSLSASILANNLSIDNNWEDLGLSYKNNILDEFQFLFSVNQSFFADLSAYFLIKTQNSGTKLEGIGSKIAENKITPDIYFYNHGNIGYGIQYKFFERFKLSIELLHQFYDGQITYPVFPFEGEKNTYTEEHSIWNNEFILGANINLINDLNIGISFSKYFKYDDYFTESRIKIQNPITLIFYYSQVPKPYTLTGSIEYTYKNYRAALQYQYSAMEYNFKSELGELYPYEINASSSYIKLSLGISLF